MLNKITENENKIIKELRSEIVKNEGSEKCCIASNEAFLKYWNQEKGFLYNLLGKSLIQFKRIEFQEDKSNLISKLDYYLNSGKETDPLFNFYFHFCPELIRNWQNADMFIREVMSPKALINNKYEGRGFKLQPKGKQKVFEVSAGCKPMRIIKKISDYLHMDSFESFRIAMSMLNNTSKLSGNLCLSIHPLDYITMSDNKSKWTSCMSWENCGCYRGGTIEMMNSPMVIVAYLTSDKEKYHGWNSKKWRQLFVVTPEYVMSVKGYPYHSETLSAASMEFIKELAEKNLGITYTTYPNKIDYYQGIEIPRDGNRVSLIKFHLNTNTMYNDFGDRNHLFMYSDKLENSPVISICDNYSGERNCVATGKIATFLNESELLSNDALHIKICDYCGDIIYLDKNPYIYDTKSGRIYCERCGSEKRSEDIEGGNRYEYRYD